MTEIYATARDAATVDPPGVEALPLNITDPVAVGRVAQTVNDVTVLVNNAGILIGEDLVTGDLAKIAQKVSTHLWGTLGMIRAFAPALAANGGRAVLTMLSAMSWFSVRGLGSHSVANAAEWAMTNSVRLELTTQGTLVTAVPVGAVDTDMQAGNDIAKMSPQSVVAAALDGIEQGRIEVLTDDRAAWMKAALAGDPSRFYGDAMVAE